jgi:hypothetical protein
MKPITRLIINALVIVLVIGLALALLGAVLDIIRCIAIAAIITIGGTYLYRKLTQRYTPAPKQVIDQSSTPSESNNGATDIARQIEARKERLDR